jgi:hypothetical protein
MIIYIIELRAQNALNQAKSGAYKELTERILYGDHLLEPMCRSQIGSYMAISDTNNQNLGDVPKE